MLIKAQNQNSHGVLIMQAEWSLTAISAPVEHCIL